MVRRCQMSDDVSISFAIGTHKNSNVVQSILCEHKNRQALSDSSPDRANFAATLSLETSLTALNRVVRLWRA